MQPNYDQGGQQPNAGVPNQFQQQPYQPPKSSKTTWVAALVVLSLLVIALGALSAWAYLERTKYKNDTDSIVAGAVSIAEKEQKSALENEFREKEKEPLTTYSGPTQFGGISLQYPKTWSAYIDETGKGASLIDGYLHPSFVPATDSGTAFALRIEVLDKAYDAVLQSYESNVKNGKVSLTPYRLPNVEDQLGSRLQGEINNGQQGHMIILPLRDKTLRVSTQANTFLSDFDNIILKNLSFTP